MSKRGADKQLTHDNWDEDDSGSEEQGQFQTASEEVIRGRIIKKARRRVHRTADDSGAAPSPFAAFSGFGSGQKSTAAGSNPFDFLVAPKEAEAKESSSAMSSPVLPRPPIRRDSGGGGSPAPEPRRSQSSEYHRQLQALNRSVLTWLQAHVEKNPLCILTPVFRDYDRHLETIERRFGADRDGAPDRSPQNPAGAGFSFGSSATAKPAVPATSSSAGFSFGSSATAKPAVPATSSSAGFSFGVAGKAAAPSSTTTGFSFGVSPGKTGETSPPPASTGFSFGLSAGKATTTSASPATSTAGFSFGLSAGKPTAAASAPAPTSTAGFTFGFQSGGQGGGAAPSTTEESEESEEPPAPVVNVVKEDDAVYSTRCKLFYKKDGSFVEKGVGMLYVKPCSGEKFSCLVRADTNLGNILLNIKLNKSIPTQRMGKNNVMMACVPNPPLDPKSSDSTPVPLLIRVKTAEAADELLRQLEEHKQ